jgi:hypothetical protein
MWMILAMVIAGMILTTLKAMADCLSYETRLREVQLEAERLRRSMAERLRELTGSQAGPRLINEYVDELPQKANAKPADSQAA